MEYKNLNLSHLDLSDFSNRKIAVEEIVKFAAAYLGGLPNPKHTANFDLMQCREIGEFSWLYSGKCMWTVEFKPF